MRILLTGAHGQLGREIIELGEDVAATIFALTKAELDITSSSELEMAVKLIKPNLVINAAAYTAVDKAEQEVEKAYAINRDAIRNLAQICKRHQVPVIHVSTDYVFDGSKSSAYLEEDKLAPINIYGASKAEGEQCLQQEWHKHLIVRTSWVFGKHGANFVKTILRLALKLPELRIVQDQKGCPTPARDLAQALLTIAQQIEQGQENWGVFHYCGDQATTWHGFAGEILKAAKPIFPFKAATLNAISSSEYPTPAKRPPNSVLSTKKMQQAFGIEAADWRKALKEVIENIYKKGDWREYIST